MPKAQPIPEIKGAFVVALEPHGDERGRFVEAFRKEWIPGVPDFIQVNHSRSERGVLRGLHYHFHQSEFWTVSAGAIRVALYDFRASSPTRGGKAEVVLDWNAPKGVYIPVGVAHGYYALGDATMNYLVSNYYDGQDELGFRWNDPEAAFPWGPIEPILSQRDKAAPLIRDIPPEKRPR